MVEARILAYKEATFPFAHAISGQNPIQKAGLAQCGIFQIRFLPCCGVSVGCKVKFVLHFGEKCPGGLRILVVIDASGVNIGDFLVKLAFAEANFPNFCQQRFKIVFVEEAAIFQPLFVQHESFDGKFPEYLGCPLAELGGAFGVDPVADGDDGIQIVEFCVVAFTVVASVSEFPTY